MYFAPYFAACLDDADLSNGASSQPDVVDFEPIAAAAEFTREGWNSGAGDLARAVVLAAALVQKTKPELVDAVATYVSTARVNFRWVLHDLACARRRCAEALEVLQSAAARLDVAMAEAEHQERMSRSLPSAATSVERCGLASQACGR
ncbi:hypothetical protein LJR225_002881 [Phenylobacterium sp. LjRoot225]|uniref:hypothetical protein n=1 Tax=Phenylobacterium sp. LjRoot225 TaxID=3342285 RepID=UPI003ECEC990